MSVWSGSWTGIYYRADTGPIFMGGNMEIKIRSHILFSPVSAAPPSEAQGIGAKRIREGLRLCAELKYDYSEQSWPAKRIWCR